MKIYEVVESGYYFALMPGPKMIRASESNSYWTIIRIEVVLDGTEKIQGKRILKSGKWFSTIGSPNWLRLDSGRIVAVEPIQFPDKSKYFMKD